MFDEGSGISLKELVSPLTNKKAIIIIFILGFIVFFNALFGEFVWDDKKFVVLNPQIRTLNVFWLFGNNLFNSVGFYRPLVAVYFALTHSIFNNTPFFYHFLQLLIHLINTSLLFYLFTKFLNKKISLFLAIIFLIHPMNVESVSFIASSGNLMFFLFGIGALTLSMTENINLKKSTLVFLLLLLSVLTKETGFSFFFIILASRLLFKRKHFPLFVSLGLLVSLLYIFLRLIIAGVNLEKLYFVPIASLSLWERTLNIPAIIVYYLKTFFFPAHLAIYQLWTIKSIEIYSFYLPLLAVIIFFVSIFLLGWLLRRSNKKEFYVLVLFFMWLAIGLSIHLQIFPLEMTVADRWFYFPMAGLLGILGIGIQNFKIKNKSVRTFGFIIAVILISVLGLRTMVRNTNWVNALTLYSHDLKVSDNFALQNDLGVEYLGIKKYDLAKEHFEKSVRLLPYETNLYNLAYVSSLLGDLGEAQKYYYLAMNTKKYPEEYHRIIALDISERLGAILILQNDPKTKSFIESSLKIYPKSTKLKIELAILEYKLGNHAEALAAAKQANESSPNEITQDFYKKLTNKEIIDTQIYLRFFL